MAGETGQASGSINLDSRLAQSARELDFFQVLRRMECAHPELPGLGRSVRPADDPVRLGQQPSLAFAPNPIAAYRPASGSSPPQLLEYFFGLFGPQGPLPLHLTEYAQQRKFNEKDPTLSAFADIFHHRMLSLLYRAWAAARPTVQFDRPDRDRFAGYVGSLFGMGHAALRGLDDLPDSAKLHFVGVLAMQSRPAEGLRVLLERFFELPAELQEFRGGWMRLPEQARLRLGETEETGLLGQNTLIGASVWGCQQRFRIVLGPLPLSGFRRVLPGTDSLRRLVALVRNYIGDEKDWDLQLVLRRDEVPSVRLGDGSYLGWTSWLGGHDHLHDANDVVLEPAPGHGA